MILQDIRPKTPIFILLWAVLLFYVIGPAWGNIISELRLRRYLFPTEFDPIVRPVENSTQNVDVRVDLSLSQLIDLKERIQVLHSEIWVRLKWYDPQLTWNPSEYGNVEIIHVQPGKIWMPDIGIYNEVGSVMGKEPTDYLQTLSSSGIVSWIYPRTVITSCKMDVFYFPFDSQNCSYILGSWALTGKLLDVINESARGDMSSYVDNGEWILLDILAIGKEVFYPCCPGDPFPEVTFTLLLQRRSLYYVYNLIGPCLLITFLHVTAFLLPAESGEKISLNVNILLGLTVFLLLVAEITPPQSEVIPVIGQYFGLCILLVALSTACSVCILHLHFRGSRGFPPPSWMRKLIIGKLGYILCYGGLIEKRASEQMGGKFSKPKVPIFVTGTVKLVAVRTIAQLRPSVKGSEVLDEHMEEGKEKGVIQDWILVSLILDRLFFLLFFIANISAAAFIFSQIARTDTSYKTATI